MLLYGAPFVKAGIVHRPPPGSRTWRRRSARLIGASPLPTYTGRVLTEAIAAGSGRPRVVTVMVLDAMRADYFDKYASVMPTLTPDEEGRRVVFRGAHRVLPTVTGVGHANIGTGSDPRFHGIVVNTLFNRATGKSQEAYDQLDTRELMALTLADQWNLTTDGKAIIIGQGGAIRATAGLVGRGSCLISGKKILAASYGGADGGWETNPDLLHHARRRSKRFVGRKVWEEAGGTWMGHDIASAQKFRASALFQKYEAEALRAVVDESSVGADDVTDLIFVNMKGPDYTSHAHGPDSKEQAATLAELDKQIAAYLALMDKKAGPGPQPDRHHGRSRTAGRTAARRPRLSRRCDRAVEQALRLRRQVHQLLQRRGEQPAAPRHGEAAAARFLVEGCGGVPRRARSVRGGLH